jgi:hypothetical protein
VQRLQHARAHEARVGERLGGPVRLRQPGTSGSPPTIGPDETARDDSPRRFGTAVAARSAWRLARAR